MSALILALALLLPASQQERVRVNAQLSQTTARVGETVVLSITIETAGNPDVDIAMPQLPSQLVIAGTQESTHMQYSIPGGRRRVVTRELILQPASSGTFVIPGIEIEVDGTVHRTRALTLQVSSIAAASPALPSGEAWLRVSLSPETVYVGQQTTLTAEAGFSEDVRLRLTRPPIFDTPSPTGFWVHELPGGVRTQLRQQENRVVEVQTRKVAYFPLSAGRFALKQSRVIVDVRQGFLYAPETREMRSNTARLTVLPLPEKDRPTTFRGAVGRYTMEAAVEPLSVAAGEPVQIKLVVRGVGNVKTIAAPRLPQVLGAEAFAPTEESETTVEGEMVGGTKTFNYVLIPENEGILEIPAIVFSYFDPVARAYRDVRAEPVQVRVLPSGAATGPGVDPATLQPLRTEPSAGSLRWVRTPGFLIVQLLPILAIAGLLFMRRRKPRGNPAPGYLARIRETASLSNQDVYAELDRIMRAALAEPAADPEVKAARGSALIERIRAARFAPAPPSAGERAGIVRESEQLVADLFAPRRTTYAALFVFALALAQQSQPGVQAYDSANYRAAVSVFEQQADSARTDASAWYNLGNAYYRAGERGYAIWAWAQALQLEPRADDVVHNLRVAGSVEPIRVRPPLTLTAEEWFFMAALLWWIAAGLVIVALARKRRVPRWAAAPALLAIVLVAIGWRATRAPQYAIARTEPVALHVDPTIRSATLRNLRAGAVLTVIETRDEWLRVRTIDNREAWVAADDVGLLNAKD
jgi:hypothetical protein